MWLLGTEFVQQTLCLLSHLSPTPHPQAPALETFTLSSLFSHALIIQTHPDSLCACLFLTTRLLPIHVALSSLLYTGCHFPYRHLSFPGSPGSCFTIYVRQCSCYPFLSSVTSLMKADAVVVSLVDEAVSGVQYLSTDICCLNGW